MPRTKITVTVGEGVDTEQIQDATEERVAKAKCALRQRLPELTGYPPNEDD